MFPLRTGGGQVNPGAEPPSRAGPDHHPNPVVFPKLPACLHDLFVEFWAYGVELIGAVQGHHGDLVLNLQNYVFVWHGIAP